MARSCNAFYGFMFAALFAACSQNNAGQTSQPGGSTSTTTAGQTPAGGQQGNVTITTPVGNGNTAQQANTVTQAQGANVRLIGRTDTVTDANGPIISWPGSQIVIGFKGTSLTVNLLEMDTVDYMGTNVDNYFAVSIDGGTPKVIELNHTAQSYAVASGLTMGQHQAVLTKRTEGQFGRVQYRGAKTDGSLTYTTAAPTRRLEFVGDSGTAGYGADGNYPCTFTVDTEDALVAYPTVTGTLLNAEVHNISYSGKGIVQNRDMVNDAVKTLPVLWENTLPNDQNVVPYNPNGWIPQAVVMTIGGNDFYAQVLDANTFESTVTTFIKKVQSTYAGVHVYLGVSPMLRDDNHPTQRETGITYAQSIVANLKDNHVHYVDLPADLGANGYGCDEHMSIATHKLVASTIAAAIKAQLGW